MAWLGRGATHGAASASYSVVGRYPEDRLDGIDVICSAVDGLSDRRAADDLSVRHRCALIDAGAEADRASVYVGGARCLRMHSLNNVPSQVRTLLVLEVPGSV
jgi:hypothetical protein